MKIVSLVFIALLLTGCSVLTSSVHYTKGTECLERGDYEAAVVELTQAVELDPTTARNRTNLASAYLHLGELDKGWYQTRQAMLCPHVNQVGCDNFTHYCYLLIVKPGLNQPGTSIEEITEKLGPPDSMSYIEDSQIQYIYGICRMKFKDGKLVSCDVTN